MMAHEERIADLERRILTLENEDDEARARRMETLWQANRQKTAEADALSRVRGRLALADQQIAEIAPWVECLAKIRADVVRDIKREENAIAASTDPCEQDELRRQLEHLQGTLRSIDGVSRWTDEGDLFERVAASGFPSSPGHKSPLGDHFMLPRSVRLLAALKKDREVVQAELDRLLGTKA